MSRAGWWLLLAGLCGSVTAATAALVRVAPPVPPAAKPPIVVPPRVVP